MIHRHPHTPLHIYLNNAEYFVTAGTYNKQPLFDTCTKKSLLRDLLKDCVQRFAVKLHAWVILDNHYHLLMRVVDKDDLTKFIKSLHGQSAIQINKLDRLSGRKVWWNYWDYCPRNKQQFYTRFNYIHINPIKHSKLKVRDGAIIIQDGALVVPTSRIANLHDALAQYEFSSYPFYLRKYGKEGMTHVWENYPIRDYLRGDDF